MKHPEVFSDEAVLKRSQKAAQATKELDVAARSAKVKRELDNAQMEKKERRPLKEFTELRTELNEGVEEVEENFIPHSSMPPNILILRRKTVRQFPNNVMVALYYNDKLGQYFSIPYGGEASDDRAVITPVSLKESGQWEVHRNGKFTTGQVETNYPVAKKHWDERTKKNEKGDKFTLVPRSPNSPINEDAISHLQKVKAFQTDKPLYHKDGSQTRIDPTTANALLTVHGALHPDNRKKFADALEHSQPKFHKMLDFAWKQVRE